MAKTTTSGTTYKDIVTSIRKRIFSPVYLLMGEESYYIDRISECVAETVLSEEEKDFNQIVIYCTRETDVKDIINTAKRYPMMSEYQTVIVKEAQNLTKLDELVGYVQNPLKSTILVLCYKNGTVDKRKKLVAACQKNGVVFESQKVKDSALPAFVVDYLKQKNVTIDNNATMMIADCIGTDLNRMAGELDKLIVALPEGAVNVTAEMVERNIGISREFNNWELRNAIVNKNVFKANQILCYFNSNPKANPPFPTLAVLFNLFSSMMQGFYAPDRSDSGIASHLGISPWQARELVTAMKNYTALKTMQVLSKIRGTDCKLKGVEKGSATDGEIMQELLFFILH